MPEIKQGKIVKTSEEAELDEFLFNNNPSQTAKEWAEKFTSLNTQERNDLEDIFKKMIKAITYQEKKK